MRAQKLSVLGLVAAMWANATPSANHQQAAKRAFTIADHYRVVGVADPQVSPDGTWVAYVTTHTDLPRGKRWSHLWLLSLADGRTRQLTQGEHGNSQPRFSPDGQHLAFISDREGNTPQLFLLPLSGGEARRLTDFPSGVSHPLWHPSGKFVAVTAQVFPECGADVACHRAIQNGLERGPLRAYLADELLFRHWDRWKQGMVSHILLVGVEDGSLTDLTPGKFDAPPFSVTGEPGYAFSPRGEAMVYVANRDPQQALSTNSDLWWLPLDPQGKPTGQAENLTAANPAWDGHPAFSPDGRLVVYRTQIRPGYESDLFRLAVYEREKKTSRILSGNFDNWIVDFRFASDGRSIVFKAEEAGRTPLFQLDLATGRISKLLTHATVDAFALTPRGEVVYVRRSVGEPTEVYSFAGGQGPPRRLTAHNQALAQEVDLRPAEELWVDSG
ncbi:MAG: hypothetical protein N2447_08630, partial [Thermoanaerobaculum sp.]|nr:hypothetical protein [Thermoanaerobaculum sp.]